MATFAGAIPGWWALYPERQVIHDRATGSRWLCSAVFGLRLDAS